ncbi:MAG: 5-formyltetrahydrofolate cyclo-ligase [bacterium]
MKSDIKSQKKILRHETIRWRESISDDNRLEWNRLICQNVCSVPEFLNSKCIAGYISFKGEVDLSSIFNDAFNLEKTLVLPATEPQNHKMFFREINNLDTLVAGGYGILEPPTENRVIDLKKIDLIIVPGVAFSRNGARLGYGGGYYDGLLAQTESLKIAVAYSGQVYNEIPTDEYDIMMDYLITEHEILKFD